MSDNALILQVSAELDADRLMIGGKAASLITLARAGAEVPPAFVLTTEAYRHWAKDGDIALVARWIDEGIDLLERRTGRRLGEGSAGLIVSVRSGAPVSMPGMMDTVLNAGLGRLGAGHEKYLYEARARFLWQYAELVIGLDEATLMTLGEELGTICDAATLERLEARLEASAAAAGKPWPHTPREELIAAAEAVFASWQSARAKLYRSMRKIDERLGTTVTIQQMVFGNRDEHSGSGVAFSRDPTSGESKLTGEFLAGGQGEDVVAGRQTGDGLAKLQAILPEQYLELTRLGRRLEKSSHKVQEIEFTIEQGRLYILQSRPALMTARAAARVAVEMHEEGLLERGAAVVYAKAQGFDPAASSDGLAVPAGMNPALTGLPVGGGVGMGRLALDAGVANALLETGDPVVFASVETSPRLLSVMQRSAALLTMRGGSTSHAAVVAREIGIPCVVGIGAEIDDTSIAAAVPLSAGDWVTVDGDSGSIFKGRVATRIDVWSKYERMLRDWATAC